MADPQQFSEQDPRHHTTKLKQMLHDVGEHAREDVSKISDPSAQAVFETIAEVTGALETTIKHLEERREQLQVGQPPEPGAGAAGQRRQKAAKRPDGSEGDRTLPGGPPERPRPGDGQVVQKGDGVAHGRSSGSGAAACSSRTRCRSRSSSSSERRASSVR